MNEIFAVRNYSKKFKFIFAQAFIGAGLLILEYSIVEEYLSFLNSVRLKVQ